MFLIFENLMAVSFWLIGLFFALIPNNINTVALESPTETEFSEYLAYKGNLKIRAKSTASKMTVI